MPKHPTEIRSLARSYSDSAMRSLMGIASKGKSESARVMACCAILERAWGKAPQTISGEDGQGAIQVIVRHIMEGAREEHRPVALLEHLKKVED